MNTLFTAEGHTEGGEGREGEEQGVERGKMTEVLLTFLSSSHHSSLYPSLSLRPSGEEEDEREKDKCLQQLPLTLSVCV